MTEAKSRPEWLSKHHSEWPAEAKAFWLLMADLAERRIARTKNTESNTNSLPSAG